MKASVHSNQGSHRFLRTLVLDMPAQASSKNHVPSHACMIPSVMSLTFANPGHGGDGSHHPHSSTPVSWRFNLKTNNVEN
jgi:hypothetical protein